MRILREPLLHFAVLGTLVYLGARYFDAGADRYRIDASTTQRERIATTYQQQYGVAPTEAQLRYLLDQYVRSEILFREGLALGLDRDDEIVRRRVVQKIEFLNEDTTAIDADDTRLQAFFAAHQSRYQAPAGVSFSQVYFAADPRGETETRKVAELALARLQRSEIVNGDRFEEGNHFAALDANAAQRIFGESQLSAAVLTAPAGQWAGPYRSAFGWHLIRIERHVPAQSQPFEQVKERVRADFVAFERDRRNEEEFRRLASKYRIVQGGEPT